MTYDKVIDLDAPYVPAPSKRVEFMKTDPFIAAVRAQKGAENDDVLFALILSRWPAGYADL